MYKAIGYTKGLNGWSVKLKRKEDKLVYWFDVWINNNDVESNWNQYIFSTVQEEDIHRNKIQDDCAEFEMADNEAVNYLVSKNIIGQDEKGNWIEIEKEED